MSWLDQAAQIGQDTRKIVRGLGFATRMFVALLGKVGVCVTRFRLLLQQIHFLGNYSLLIMVVSGFFIGAVLSISTIAWSIWRVPARWITSTSRCR